jgi:flagellar protein FliO/FliZ
MRPRHFITLVFCSLWLATAQAQTAPGSAVPTASLGGSIAQMVFGLGVVLLLLFAGLWVLKKITGTSGVNNSLVKVVGGTAIGTRERIVVVEMGQTWLVLGVTPNSINTLAEMPRQALPPGGSSQTPDFAKWLRATIERRNAR